MKIINFVVFLLLTLSSSSYALTCFSNKIEGKELSIQQFNLESMSYVKAESFIKTENGLVDYHIWAGTQKEFPFSKLCPETKYTLYNQHGMKALLVIQTNLFPSLCKRPPCPDGHSAYSGPRSLHGSLIIDGKENEPMTCF